MSAKKRNAAAERTATDHLRATVRECLRKAAEDPYDADRYLSAASKALEMLISVGGPGWNKGL